MTIDTDVDGFSYPAQPKTEQLVEAQIGINGLTEAETCATASVMGLVGKAEQTISSFTQLHAAIRKGLEDGSLSIQGEAMLGMGGKKIGCVNHDCDQCKAQPQQEPLTDEEIGSCIDEVNLTSQYGHHHFGWHKQFARAIEAKQGIKENT